MMKLKKFKAVKYVHVRYETEVLAKDEDHAKEEADELPDDEWHHDCCYHHEEMWFEEIEEDLLTADE